MQMLPELLPPKQLLKPLLLLNRQPNKELDNSLLMQLQPRLSLRPMQPSWQPCNPRPHLNSPHNKPPKHHSLPNRLQHKLSKAPFPLQNHRNPHWTWISRFNKQPWMWRQPWYLHRLLQVERMLHRIMQMISKNKLITSPIKLKMPHKPLLLHNKMLSKV